MAIGKNWLGLTWSCRLSLLRTSEPQTRARARPPLTFRPARRLLPCNLALLRALTAQRSRETHGPARDAWLASETCCYQLPRGQDGASSPCPPSDPTQKKM